MTLITSISGIRGTLGGEPGENLTPIDVVKYVSAYGAMLQAEHSRVSGANDRLKVVIGRDARSSGPLINNLACSTLLAMGIDVLDLGLSTTPTVELAVPAENAHGGIVITASHNPGQWNALKLLNASGEFLDDGAGKEILRLADTGKFSYAAVDALGHYSLDESYLFRHVQLVCRHPLVDTEAIAKAGFSVALDAVCSSGGVFVPTLLRELGVETIEKIHCAPTGDFPHNPEPLPEHLTDLSALVRDKNCDLGIVVDPDVDRLAFVCEDGSVFGEEYTLVAVADYVLGRKGGGNTVSNLSSTRALRDVTEKHGGSYTASAVGEVNVVKAMKDTDAIIGGEGNGGIIDPKTHYGRDALVGIGLFLSHLARSAKKMTELRASYPQYYMSKNKIQLTPSIDVDAVLDTMAARYATEKVSRVDGVKIDFADRWVHLRKSNTEPIIRVYTEASSEADATGLAREIMDEIKSSIS